MRANLEQLQRDILAHLRDRGLVIFRSYPRGPELGADAVYWDTDSYPDFREFIAAAEAVEAKMITVAAREFSGDSIEEALGQLAESNLDRDERRTMESRLREMRSYEGFICEIELSFSHGRRTYIFDQPTDWYNELTELIEKIEDSYEGSTGEHPLGGFYSNN